MTSLPRASSFALAHDSWSRKFSKKISASQSTWNALKRIEMQKIFFTPWTRKHERRSATLPIQCHSQGPKECPCQVSCWFDQNWTLEGYIQTDTQSFYHIDSLISWKRTCFISNYFKMYSFHYISPILRFFFFFFLAYFRIHGQLSSSTVLKCEIPICWSKDTQTFHGKV